MKGKTWLAGGSLTRLNLASAFKFTFALVFAPGAPAIAQAEPLTLTVQPRTMATGTHNPPAGSYPLDDTLPSQAIVTVPPQCVGARRCPLFIFVGRGVGGAAGPGALIFTKWLRPAADKYGMILLALANEGPGLGNPQAWDRLLRQVLQRFAIDPAKIAIVGRCGAGVIAVQLGFQNLHVFSRIAVVSGGPTDLVKGKQVNPDRLDPRSKRVEFLIDHETTGYIGDAISLYSELGLLRRAGFAVKHIATLRNHEHQWEDYDFLGHWLAESWRIPDPAARPAPAVVADPLPRLTPQVMAKMTAFWIAFQQLPDSIRTTARREHLREVVLPVPARAEDQLSTWITDMAALAAHYPAVATALAQAGLTGQEHDAYRVALLSSQSKPEDAALYDPATVLGQNVAFAKAHSDEYAALSIAGVEDNPNLMKGVGVITQCCNDPQWTEKGALGIWMMP